ncbi:MAG: protein kinase [Planctomycetaceae bacterium]|nr:protein kinase [Planctomycetaceae bacterium]
MTDSNSQSLDDVIAIYLEALDSGYSGNPEDFIAQWPQYRAELLQFVAQNKTVDQLFGSAHDLPPDSGSLQSPEFDPESFGSGYRIRQVIGRGGMGTVYEAIRISDNERVAVKILNARTTLNTQHRQRFDRESRAIASLDHPHIVPLYSVGAANDTPFLVMKLIDGVTLSEIISQRSDVRAAAAECFEAAQRKNDYFSTIARLTADVAGALEAAHQSNIIHRDVKPSNLLLDTQGKVWLTDFGLASIGEGHATLTASGDIMGTPAYMSPEQAVGDHRMVDHRSDIYSLGATLYALATGKRPYVGTSMQVLREVSEGLLTPPSRFRRDIPRDLEAIILKAMARNPAKRYQSAAEFEYDLRRFTGGRSVRAKSPGLIDHTLQWISRYPRLTIVAVTSLSASILSIILIQWIVSHRLTGLNEKLSSSNQRLSELNEDLVTSQRTLEHNIYDADISNAYRAYAQGDIDRSRELLARYGPNGDHPELAGFEWRLLDKLSRPVRIRRFKAHSDAAREVAVLPGSTQYVSVGDDGLIRRGDLNAEESLADFKVNAQLAAIAVSQNQKTFVIGENVVDGINPVALRDLETGGVLQQLTGHEYTVESAAFSPSGKLIATAGRYQDVLVHSVDGTLQHRLTTGSRNESLAFSADEKHLLTVFRQQGPHNKQFIRAWDLNTFQPTFDIPTDFFATTFALSESGRDLVVADPVNVARITFPGGITLASHEKLRGRIRNVAISSDGGQYAAGCDNGLIYLWDLTDDSSTLTTEENGQADPDLALKPVVVETGGSGITSLAFVENDELISTNTNGEILLCERPKKNPAVGYPKGICCFQNSRSAPNRCIARLSNGAVVTFNLFADRSRKNATADQTIIRDAELDSYATMAVSPNETLVAVGTQTELVIAGTNTVSSATRIELPEPDKNLRSLMFSANEDMLFALFNDRLFAFRTSDWTLLKEIQLPNENAGRLCLTQDGSTIIVLSESELLFLNASTFGLQKSFSMKGVRFSAVTLSRSGKLLAIGCDDGTTHIADAGTLSIIAVIRGHRATIQCADFYNHDELLMTCDTHGDLRLWDVIGQREMGFLHIGDVQCAIVEEHDSLVTWGGDVPLRIWSACEVLE